MDNKTIGILTMHKVLNYGSALQAYALQKYMDKLGYNNEIIDYLYPTKKAKPTLKQKIASLLPYNIRKKRKFKNFWNSFLRTSQRTFTSYDQLTAHSCNYDIYLTGSDQVWNPLFKDEVLPFMFNFIEGGKKLSYAASFSSGNIEESYKPTYTKYLSQYQHISVREESSIKLVKELTGKDAVHVCDPTFLLDDNDWNEIANNDAIKTKEPYILVYILSYAYNPYPHIFNIIEKVRKELNYKVIFIDGSLSHIFKEGYKLKKGNGPADFLSLFKNASFVITTSFHGTAFSINFKRPVISVIQPDLNKDSRMYSILKQVGLEEQAVIYNKPFEFNRGDEDIYTPEVTSKICSLRKLSRSFLKDALEDLTNK